MKGNPAIDENNPYASQYFVLQPSCKTGHPHSPPRRAHVVYPSEHVGKEQEKSEKNGRKRQKRASRLAISADDVQNSYQ
jgi:hypothetical protein